VILLKLGGSLITDKARPLTARSKVIQRIAHEIAEARRKNPGLELVLGHGSGSFGHSVAARHGTQQGAKSEAQWKGFIEVWSAAQALNRIVLEALLESGLPSITFSPSASAICYDGELADLAIEPIRHALEAHLVPVVHGDVAFDRQRGAAILSTEDVFILLAQHLKPARALLAGIEAGVFAVYPTDDAPMDLISESDLDRITWNAVQGADVTGGMEDKVHKALALSRTSPDTEVRIFSGLKPGSLTAALLGSEPGTRILSRQG
jgi:isopentenyl phosphate kinase